MRYLIVGYGNIGRKRKAALGKKCVATVDPSTKTGADYKDSSDIPPEVLKKFDACVVASSKKPKFDLVYFWLNKGKHVLVEKPFIISPKQARELSLLANKNKVIWYTGYNHRYEPNIKRIKTFLEKGVVGKLYHARLVYGFGNIQQLLGTWRDTGYGALDEVGSHLIDLTSWFFGYKGTDFVPVSLRKIEGEAYDYCLFATKDQKVIIEIGWVMWKNTFVIEIFGKDGSIHMNGLRKWEGSKLILRKRVLPAGVPEEKRYTDEGPDKTWQRDFKSFEKMAARGKTSVVQDLLISSALVNIAYQKEKGRWAPKINRETIYKKFVAKK